MSVFDKVRPSAEKKGRRDGSDERASATEHVCVFCRRDFDPERTRDCPACGAELVYHGTR